MILVIGKPIFCMFLLNFKSFRAILLVIPAKDSHTSLPSADWLYNRPMHWHRAR